jgi:3-oxoacyl-[acyl-carrier protein] reductase
MQLADKTVVISGGGRGIGRAIAERLGREGARVALLDVSAADLEAARSAAKAGVAALSVVWAKELARYGIRTGTIAPGGTRTDILSSMRPEMLDCWRPFRCGGSGSPRRSPRPPLSS